MTTKHFCDICGAETKNHAIVEIDTTMSYQFNFDVCDNCILNSPLKIIVQKLLIQMQGVFQCIKIKGWHLFPREEETT